MTWYKNTSIWSAVLAASALILSQLPPISKWFPDPQLEIIHADRIAIHNNIGVLGFYLPIELDNKGNIPLDINKIYLEVTGPNGVKKTYFADSFSRPSTNGATPINLPITSINLNEKDLWSEFVFFVQNIDPSTEQRLSNIRLSITKSIYSDIDKKRSIGDYSRGEAEPDYIKIAENYFNSHFDLKKGEYETKLIVETTQTESPFIVESEFTVYDYHIETVKAQVDDYKYGAGINYPSDNSKQAWIKIKPNK